MARLVKDLQFAFRQWRKYPGFAVAAILTLALGIALNTSTFGFINALWFRPMAVRDDARVVVLVEQHPTKGGRFQIAYPNFRDWAEQNRSFESLAALEERPFNFATASGAIEPEFVGGALVTASSWDLLGIQPLVGRAFSRDEAEGREILISERLWRRRFGADPAVIGSEALVDGERATITGVLPYRFRFIYGGYDVVGRLGAEARLQDRGARTIQVIGRLKQGVTLAAARAEMESLGRQLTASYPLTNAGWRTDAVPFREFVFSSAKRMYPVLMGASTFLLLIVFANISNLLLAKASARRREIAVRLALGCSRSGIVRQLVAEGVLLALAGGTAGFILTAWTRWIVVAQYPELAELVIDYRVFAFTALVSMATGIAFGLAPAMSMAGADLKGMQKAGGAFRLRRALVVTQLALAVVLLVGTGLLIRSAWKMRSAETGFRPAGLLTAQISLRGSRYGDAARQGTFLSQLEERLQAIPEVQAATVTAQLPLLGGPSALRVEASGRAASGKDETMMAARNAAGPEYLAAFGIRLLAGRGITREDSALSTRVALINDSMARRLWADASPARAVGQRIRVEEGAWLLIVGVTSGTRQVLTRPPFPEVITPITQTLQPSVSLAVRSVGDPYRVAGGVRKALRDLDEGIALSKVQTMEDIQAEYFPRVMTAGLGIFAAVALGLAAMGLYGVIAFLAAQRTQEIGLRIALGASRQDILRMVAGQGLRFTLAGVAAGLAGAFAVARLLAGELFGVSPTDPPVFAGVSGFLVAVALLACLAPARRAARIDPQRALRYE